jgi:hypothetical protein
MSEYAVVLQKKDSQGKEYVVKASNFGALADLDYTKDGKVKGFTFQDIVYYSVYDVSTGAFIDYVDQKKFNALVQTIKQKDGSKYSGVSVSLWKSSNPNINITFTQYTSLTVATLGDMIYGKLRDETFICYNYYIWPYNNPYTGPPANPTKYDNNKPSVDCDILSVNSVSKGFFDYYRDYIFWDTDTTDQRLIGELASLINKVDQKLLDAFNQFTIDGVNTGVFQFRTNINGYSHQDFLDYRNALQKWLKIYELDIEELKKLKDPEKIYIICEVMCRYNMLQPLSIDLKILILSVFVNESLTNWTKFSFINYEFQQRESLALRVIQSVTNQQAAEFLHRLTSTIITSIENVPGGTLGLPDLNYEVKNSLYKLLFYKMDDFGGNADFTSFINTINKLVLTVNEITSDDATHITPAALKTITEFQFIWGSVNNKNKIKYSVTTRNDSTVKFLEETPSKTVIRDVTYTSSTGIPVGTYPETVIEYVEQVVTLNHFDVVSIHFYENPSFVDTTGLAPNPDGSPNTGYLGHHYITFAGFVDYIIEKEETALIEQIAQTALLALSLTVGFGELVVAIRSVSVARFIVGAMIVTGDTSVYLSTNSQFRSYIQTKFPDDYNNILDLMLLAGAIVSLGGSSAAAKIFDAYDVKEAGEFIGTAQKVLGDPEISAKLTANELNVLKEGLLRFQKGLNPIKNTEVAKAAINRGKAVIAFFDNQDLKSAIRLLDEDMQTRFFNDFGNASKLFSEGLKDNPEYVNIWNNYTEEQKLFAKSNQLESLENEINNLRFTNEYHWTEGGLPPLLDDETVLENFGQFSLNLVIGVNAKANTIISLASSGNELGDYVLVAGMVDAETGIISKLFTNYLRTEIPFEYEDFLANKGPGAVLTKDFLQPNMAERLQITSVKKGAGNYNLSPSTNPKLIERTGSYMGSHAEFRALNDLACKKFGNVKIDPIIFDRWLQNVNGYNRYLRKPGIQPTCVDCFYLTFGVKFIK